jgi:flagellar hook-basal body complex protein FliE
MLAAMNQIEGVALGGTNALSGLGGLQGTAIGGTALAPPANAAGESAPFSDLLTDAVGEVGRLEDQARITTSGLMTGSGVDVHQAMIATEKAGMAFELALAVRNKAVQAYQQVMSMQF